MRGSVTMNDLLHVYSYEDIKMITDLIDSNLEITKTTKIPFV